MEEHEAVRRLVKSPPELWAQCSDPAMLGRHLRGFGEIRITRLDPENTVAWEGESARGTVSLEASGWGTRVRLTATPPASGSVPGPPLREPTPAPGARTSAPTPAATPPAARPATSRGLAGLLSTLWRRGRAGTLPVGPGRVPASPAPGPPSPAPSAPRASPDEVIAGLEAALDSLGQAHHRPYSRA
ncbi:MAG TPA: hypothetical protein VFN48_10800 [Solirubrobacteraceae bacterium]|nr:hypothetical protein [Solirubrobacteraceae bacterium]